MSIPQILKNLATLSAQAAKGTGSAAKTVALSTPGRTVLGAGAGYGGGYTLGRALEKPLGLDEGALRSNMGIIGAGIAAPVSSPFGRAQLHRFAGRAPTEPFRPVRDTINLLAKPTYPFERLGAAGKGTLGRYAGNTLRVAPWAGSAAGLGIAAKNFYDYFPVTVSNALYDADVAPDVIEKVKGEARRKSPQLLYNLLAPRWMDNLTPTSWQNAGWRSDKSGVGDFHRNAVMKFVLPEMRHGFYRTRKEKPLTFGTIDTLRSMTPAGFAQTKAINSLGTRQPPATTDIMRQVFKDNKEPIINNPKSTVESPILQLYAKLLSNKDLQNDPNFKTKMQKLINDGKNPNASEKLTQQAITNVAERKVPEILYPILSLPPTKKRISKEYDAAVNKLLPTEE